MDWLETYFHALFTKQRWAIHTFFWLVVLVVYAVIFGHKNSNYAQTFFLVGLLMPVTMASSYFLNYYLLPRYLMKERYGLFVIYFLYVLILSLCAEILIVTLTFIVMAERKMTDMSPASIDMFVLLAALLMIVFLGGAIKLLLHWRNSREDYQKLLREKVEVELRFLKTQLHPHFLFNTLNNLYYLALEKSDKTPGAILALSELLDYVLHDTKAKFVSLEKELKQVQNYTALESLRYQDRLNVNVKIEGDLNEKEIAPMMLITLIENSFKHGVTNTINEAWINFKIFANDEKILVHLENNTKKKTDDSIGVGLRNLQGQLDLLYNGRARLKIESQEETFVVELELKEEKMKFKYLVVDDEQLARKLIISHASKIETLELANECSSAVEAVNYLQRSKVDLIFLDIQMPELTGLDFIRTLKNPPAIILTTAYRDFAIEAFELDALDYILKPISFERLLKSVNKFFQTHQITQTKGQVMIREDVVHIRSDRKTYPIELEDILFIESLDDYVKVHLKDQMLITRENISTLERKLPNSSFVRIHRSFIISKRKIESVSGESVWIGGKELPFGRAFKHSALALLKLEK